MLPIMGLFEREITEIVKEQSVAFDTVRAYSPAIGGEYTPLSSVTFKGNNTQYFTTLNRFENSVNLSLFFASNFNQSVGGISNSSNNSF